MRRLKLLLPIMAALLAIMITLLVMWPIGDGDMPDTTSEDWSDKSVDEGVRDIFWGPPPALESNDEP